MAFPSAETTLGYRIGQYMGIKDETVQHISMLKELKNRIILTKGEIAVDPDLTASQKTRFATEYDEILSFIKY